MAREITFLSNAAGGSSTDWFTWDGGRGTFFGAGTIGTSMTLEVKGANDVATPVGDDTTFDALPGLGNFDLPPCQLRVTTVGGSGLYATAKKNGEV